MLSVLRSGLADLRTRPTKQIAGLDALRSCAVLLVIFDHFRANIWLRLGGDPDFWIASNPLTTYGWAGVDLFFVLSGFFIGAQVWKERQQTGHFRVGRFVARRGFRIWPLYFASMLALAIGLGRTAPQWSDWLLLSNYWPTAYARSWSLSTEEHFYLALPLLLLLTRRYPLHFYPWLIGAVWVLTDAVRVATSEVLSSAGMAERGIDEAMYSPFHLHNQGLLVGLLISYVFVMRPEWFRRPERAGWSWTGALVAMSMAAVGFGLRAISGLIFSYSSLALIFGGAVIFILLDRSWLSHVLGARTWYVISRLSYGMYLNHLMFGSAAILWVARTLQQAGGGATLVYTAALCSTILLSVVIAVVTFLCIEHPFLLIRERWAHRATARTAAVAA